MANMVGYCDGLNMFGPWEVALLGSVALLEWVWSCWSGCGLVGGSMSVESGLEVSEA